MTTIPHFNRKKITYLPAKKTSINRRFTYPTSIPLLCNFEKSFTYKSGKYVEIFH